MKNIVIIKENKFIKIVAIILSVIFSCTVISTFLGFVPYFILNVLWCGLYGCILVCLAFKSKWIRVSAISLNLISFGFISFVCMMGGLSAPFWLLLKAIVPFISLS